MAFQWEKVYVFISSTFNDMHAERDYLVKRVFPDLREWCEQRKLRLIDIDLRWGVTEADAANKQAVKVCLQRINDCRPFFLCFLGQRHGWAPGVKGISDETFQEFADLRESLHPAASITELEIRHAIFRPFASFDGTIPEIAKHASFYFRDPEYLQNLAEVPRQLLCIYTDDAGPEDETAEESKQRELSRIALQNLKHQIEISEKAPPSSIRPIHYSAHWDSSQETPELAMPLDCPHQDENSIRRWRSSWNRFADLDLTEDETSIPEPKRPSATRYNAALTKGRLSRFAFNRSEPNRFARGTELTTILKQDMMEAILMRHPDRREPKETTELQREIDQHDEFISNSVEGFLERSGDFAALDAYVESDVRDLFVLMAPGGMGKSTLLGKWVDRYRAKISGVKNHSIHARFISQSDQSTTSYSLLRFLMREIKEVYQKLDPEIPEHPVDLRNQFPNLLKAIGEKGKTIIVIDALNQLESGLSDLNWLPRILPQNIKLIVSFKRDDQKSDELYKQLKSTGTVQFSEVRAFENKEDRKALVNLYLNQYLKQLDPALLQVLIDSPAATNPLYLKVVLSELRVFGAFANLSEKIRHDFGNTPVTAFEAVLKRLETDPIYSPMEPEAAIPMLFGLLAQTRHGLSVSELANILVRAFGLPDTNESQQAAADTVNLFFRQMRSFLARRDGRYDFFYESFKIAAQNRYVTEKQAASFPKRHAREWHSFLGNFFLSQALSVRDGSWIGEIPRGLKELLFHLQSAEQWGDIIVCLREPGIFDHLWPGVYGVDFYKGVYGELDPNALEPTSLEDLPLDRRSEIGYAIADAFAQRARDLIRKTKTFQKPWPQTADWLRKNDKPGFAEFRDTFYWFIRLAERTAKFALVAFGGSQQDRTKLNRFLHETNDIHSFLSYLENFGHSETGLSHALEDDAYPGRAAWNKVHDL